MPAAKGQSSVKETNRISTINEDSLLKAQKQLILKFGPRQDGKRYVVNGAVYNDSLIAMQSLNKVEPWLYSNDFRRKKHKEKNFKYIPFQHFLENLPAFQR